MKRFLSILLLLVLTLSLCACGVPSKEAPLMGKWQGQDGGYVEFKEDGDTIHGTWYHSDAQGGWETMEFAVKSTTAFTLTLTADGTEKTVSFAMCGDTLFFNGLPYTNSGKNVRFTDGVRARTLIHDGKFVPVYGSLFMGMTRDEVEAVLGQPLSEWTASEYTTRDYEHLSFCDYSGETEDAEFGFDADLRLVHVSGSVYDDCAAYFESENTRLTDLFGDSTRSYWDDFVYIREYHWTTGGYEVILETAHDNQKTQEIRWVSSTWFKK